MSKINLQRKLSTATAERELRSSRGGYGTSVSDRHLDEYIRTLTVSIAAMPDDPPIVAAVTDVLIAECMASVSDPLRWGSAASPQTVSDMMREFSHALAARLASVQSGAAAIEACRLLVLYDDAEGEIENPAVMKKFDNAVTAARAALASHAETVPHVPAGQDQEAMKDEYRKGFIDGQIDMRASMQAEAPQATKDWRQRRADEIEILVAQNKMSAMACFTQMRQLIANPPATKDAEDAARYRWLRENKCVIESAIDAARKSQGEAP